MTPGHDGYPLALVLIKWSGLESTFSGIGFRAWERPIAISIFRQQTWTGTLFP